ncbi:FecR family protein [Chitinophaga lutea]
MNDQSPMQDPGGLSFRFRRKPVPEEKTAESWEHIQERISLRKRSRKRRVLAVLAAVALAPVIAYASYYIYCSMVSGGTREYHTAYGEIRQVMLPDSSLVYLNANSTLRIPEEWDPEERRSVWLDGEAYFEIMKKPGAGDARFVVHTPAIDVEVLGTKFNVNMLGKRTTVSLKEGKVQLTAREQISEGPKVFMMKPGDEVFVENDHAGVRQAVNTELIADWRNHRYHFENTTMTEMSAMILSKYGYKVVMHDTALWQRTISGDLHARDITQLARALSVTMNITIEQKDKQLIFSVKE